MRACVVDGIDRDQPPCLAVFDRATRRGKIPDQLFGIMIVGEAGDLQLQIALTARGLDALNFNHVRAL